MKFEQVLKIYWTKGFLFNGRLTAFNVTLRDLFKHIGGFQGPTKKRIIKRFELYLLVKNPSVLLTEYDKDLLKSINILLSQMSSVNNQVSEIDRYSLIRLYLIKSYRGRGQALGKPVRGQRTWSNAWTAYHYNRSVRSFIGTMQKILKKNEKEETINYKVLKKRIRKSKNKANADTKKKLKITPWF